MHIRKSANEGTSLGSNEKKNAEKHMNKIEATFAEGKQKMNSYRNVKSYKNVNMINGNLIIWSTDYRWTIEK